MIDLNERAPAPAAVIDLNDVWQPPPRYDLAEVRRRLAATARDWLPQLIASLLLWRRNTQALHLRGFRPFATVSMVRNTPRHQEPGFGG
jgi:hypothetical protein